MVFLAEMGDKTHLFLIGLSSKFKLKSIIVGVAAAILVLNAAAVALGFFIGNMIDQAIIKCIAGAAFLVFAYTSLFPKKEEEGETKSSKFAALTVFLSFLLAELGDKTQLMTLTLSADARAEGAAFPDAIVICIAASLGLFLADLIGMLIGYFLSKKLPEKVFNSISFVIFTAFGLYTVYEAADHFSGGRILPIVIVLISVTVLFAALCAVTLILIRKKQLRERSLVTGRKNEKRDSKDDESV